MAQAEGVEALKATDPLRWTGPDGAISGTARRNGADRPDYA